VGIEGVGRRRNRPAPLQRFAKASALNSQRNGLPPVETVWGVFVEGKPIYPTAGFDEKTHIQIAVNNPACIKGVFRVPKDQLEPLPAR
jgi:hypothetical protein